MGRGAKIALGLFAGLLALLAINALVTDAETRPAEVTVPGGRLLDVEGTELQVVDRGPRGAEPIVLVHCFTCAIDWWDAMMPRLERGHRVVALDLLGHGGSEKPSSGYSVPDQADLLARALGELGVREATVVGHSLGGAVTVALAERSPDLVRRIAILDSSSAPDDEADLGPIARLAFLPVIGEALWRVKPDFSVRHGLEVAFAPGFEVPDAFVEDVKRMNYSAYHDSAAGFDDYIEERPLGDRAAATGKPLMVIMGAEEQLIAEPVESLRTYAREAPAARTEIVERAGHSPNVERPERTSALVLDFAEPKTPAKPGERGSGLQSRLQNRDAVRGRS